MEEKTVFTLKDELRYQLDLRKIDVSSNFLNGVATSPYNPMNAYNQAIAQVNQVTTQATQAWNNVSNNFATGIQAWSESDLKEQLVNQIKDYIITDIVDYCDSKTAELTSKIASLTMFSAERITYWTAFETKEAVQKVVQDFFKDSNKEGSEKQMEDEKESITTKIKKGLNEVQTVKSIVNDTTKIIYNGIDEITSVMSAGPDYIAQNVNKLYSKTVPPVKSQIDRAIEIAFNEAQNGVECGAQIVGKAIAQTTAKATQLLTGQTKSKAEEAKATAKSYAKAATEMAINKAKALAGM